MSTITLDNLVKTGQIEEKDAPQVVALWDEIKRLKKEKNAFIPAHNYQLPEVQAVADYIGDSFELAVKSKSFPSRMVVFCGVKFMAEGCYTLAPERPVYVPSMQALCSLAEVDPEEVKERQEFLRELGYNFSTMTYVNTYADVKALSDSCCTSSNAAKIADKLGKKDILFVPDQNLAYQVAMKTKRMYLPPPNPHLFNPKEYKEMIEPLVQEGEKQGLVGNVFAWEGACHVHHQMTGADILQIRKQNPEAMIVVHGEVRPELQRLADEVLSTSQMIKYVENNPDKKHFAILTECGLVIRLELEHPEKSFFKACRVCRYMKANNLQNILDTLRDEPEAQKVSVPENVRVGAAKAMQTMIDLAMS
jgi:quinolinate synthase